MSRLGMGGRVRLWSDVCVVCVVCVDCVDDDNAASVGGSGPESEPGWRRRCGGWEMEAWGRSSAAAAVGGFDRGLLDSAFVVVIGLGRSNSGVWICVWIGMCCLAVEECIASDCCCCCCSSSSCSSCWWWWLRAFGGCAVVESESGPESESESESLAP